MKNKIDKSKLLKKIKDKQLKIMEAVENETDPIVLKNLRNEFHRLQDLIPFKDSIKETIKHLKETLALPNDLKESVVDILQKAIDDGRIK